MAKGKKKEKAKKKKKVKPAVLTWREQLSAMNPNAVRKGCSVELSMLVEGFPKYLDLTQKLQFYTYPRATLKLQCVIYEEILYIIKHYPAWKRSYLDANVEAILQQAVDEAKPFLKSRKPIPLELMAQLIKLRVIMSVQEHVCAASGQTPVASSVRSSESSSSSTFTEEDAIGLEERPLMIEHIYEEEATTITVSEYNNEDVFGNIPEIDEVVYADSSTELRGYIRALKSKREEFLRRTGEGKAEKSLEEVSSIYGRVSKNCKPPWSIKHRKWKKHGTSASKSVVLDEEERSLHLILTGFYDAALITELWKIGLPIVCLIGVAKDQDVPAEPVFSQKIYSLESVDDIQTRHLPIYNYTLHSADEQLKNYMFTKYYKKLILYHCYETLEELLDSDPTLQNIIYFRCEPTLEQGEEIYERVCELMQEIPRLRTVHSEYLRKIELCHLGKTPKAIPASQMICYNASLDKIPSDCFSISILLDGLLEEVCQSTSPNSNKKQEERERAKIFKRSKFRRVPKHPLQFMRRRNTMMRSSSLDLKVDLSRFMVHEKNVLETSLRYYPQVKDRLLAVNLAYLGLSRPAVLWRRYPKSKKNSDLDENQYFHWASSLQLSREELNTCLQVYMFKFLTCPKSSRADVSCDLQKYFRKPFEVAAPISPDTKDKDEKTPDLRWQEDCSCKTMLQEVMEASIEFRCMDHIHVPFMDVIFLRFHDDSDDFGTSSRTWSEMIRAPVGLLDFFKWVVHQDKDWIANLDGPNTKTLFGYDFGRWRGIQGVSTVFRSSEGFSIRVDKEWCFARVPHLSIHYEASGHSLHLNTPTQNNGFMFHFLLANGCRVLFAKPARVAEGKNCEGYRKSPCKIERPKPICYLVEKTSYAYFKDRQMFCKPQLLTGASLKNVLRRSSTISELDSLGSIELKSKHSTVTLSKSRNRNGGLKKVFKRIKTFKKSVVPHFKICSSILHRYRYVKVDRERLIINFANFTTTIKFIPNAKLKFQVEISPCFYLPPQNEEGQTLDADYDVRVSLPSGLQVLTRKGLHGSSHVVQYYATEKGPMCKNIEDEVSRTYLRSGFVCIKYADGSLKMLGVNGVGAKCEAPFITGLRQKTRRRKPRGLIQRYQGKFVNGRLKHYLRRLKGGWKSRRDPDLMELCAKIGSAGFVTGDGRKFSVNKGGLVDVRVDFEVYGREVGAHSSINQNGELTTVYPDGTRITSWYRVEQDMVVSGNPLSGQLELDEDDYLCNFLIPRRGGWISVQLDYQFEHPNYATVIYGGGDENSMQLRLPGGAELRTQTKGYSLNVEEQIFADISVTEIVLHSNFCRKCYDSCVTKFNIKYLYGNSKLPSANEYLLEANDNFGKVFRVTYDGRWHRNEDYKTDKVKRDCLTHRKVVSEKYYAWNRDLSGKVFWNQDMYLNRMMAAQYGKMQRVKYYLDDEGGLMAYEFLKYVRRHYCQRFLMEYGPPDPPIFKLSKSQSDNPFETIAFTKRSFIKVIPVCEKEPPSRDDADNIRVSFDFGDFSKWVNKIQDRMVFECKLDRMDENKGKCQFPKTDSFVPVAPKNSPLENVPKITRRSSETDQINLLASVLPTALLVQDDFLQETAALSNLSSGIEVLRSEPKFKDKSTCTTIRFDLFRDDYWMVAPSETSLTPPVSVNAQPKSVPRRKEFVCKRPTRIEPLMERPKAKATSTVTLEAFCRCRRSLRDLIRESPQVTSEFVRKPRPDPAALQKHSLYAKNIIKCNQKFYKQLECKLLGKRGRPKAKIRTSIQDLSHLRRDSCESVISQELQSTLPLVLPASTSEDSCKILLAPKSAIVTRSEKKFARPFFTVGPLPKEEEDSVGEDKLLEESYQGNLTPQSFDVFLKMLRKRLRKIEEVDDSETVRKVGECFDLLIKEEEMPFPKKIVMFQDSLKLLRTKHKDADCPKSSVADVII